MSKIKIAFVYYDYSSFVRQDSHILSRHFEVEEVKYRKLPDIFRMASSIWKSDISFSWFASGHSFAAVLLSKMLGKRSIIVAGGYDVACVPQINYGQFTQTWPKRFMTAFSLNHADLVLPVSEFTKREVLRWARPKEMKVVYNGIDIEKFRTQPIENSLATENGQAAESKEELRFEKESGFKEDEEHKEEGLVITVGGINRSNIKRKGLETLVKAAKLMPDARVVIIGKILDDSVDHLKSIASTNVSFTGFVDDEVLLGWYRRAKVYAQLSLYESFGMSLAEAMLCGCVPVVTDMGALPEVVGDTGFAVPYGDEKATAEGILSALGSDKGSMARKRIVELFPLKKREEALVKAIKETAP